MIYYANITNATLRVRESRIIADLLLQKADRDKWHREIFINNILQIKSPKSIISIAQLVRRRLETMNSELWEMVRDGDKILVTQCLFACAIKHSKLIGDFLRIYIKDQKKIFATKLVKKMWTEYLSDCRGRDPEMKHWSDTTSAKLRSIVWSMLAETGYIQDIRNPILQNVFIDEKLCDYLRRHNEKYVLQCMELE